MALVIILIAALVIYSRVDLILGGAASGEFSGSKPPSSTSSVPTEPIDDVDPDADADQNPVTTVPGDDTEEPGDAVTAEKPATGSDSQDNTTTAPSEPVMFTVEVGTSSGTIARNLVAAGLIPSIDAFNKEVVKQKAETKLKAGTFKIKPGMSVKEIVKLLSK